MIKTYKPLLFAANLLITLFSSVSIHALDFTYDAPKEKSLDVFNKDIIINKFTNYPMYYDNTPFTSISSPHFVVDSSAQNKLEIKGINIKIPMLSSDKTPPTSDDRTAVQLSNEKHWLEEMKKKGKKFDDNPLNADNYRLTIEAEILF